MNLEECTCEHGQVANPACPIHGTNAPKGAAVNKIQITLPWDSSDEDTERSRNDDEEKAEKEQEKKDLALKAEESVRMHLEVLNLAQYEMDERIKEKTIAEEELRISCNLLNQHKRGSDNGLNISL